MLGQFQHSSLRLEVEATQVAIADSLLRPDRIRQWLWTQRLPMGLPDYLFPGLEFASYVGPIEVRHSVTTVTPDGLFLSLSGGIDGVHQWHWGEGWVQSSLEGISLLPLNLGQTISLFSLRQFLDRRDNLAS
jgi:hypothetical protein